ncbi:hypothetical protein LZN09_23970, partial [Pseudomonas aeruginosa]|nr:hypothetical protein [Pseudomonas aeruginosa]
LTVAIGWHIYELTGNVLDLGLVGLVKATTVRGRIAEGRFTGLDSEGRLVIRREMPGAGEASYLLRPAEIARLELLER